MINLDKLVARIRKAGLEWVEANLTATQLEKDQGPYLASLINTLRKSEETSEVRLKVLAEGSAEYRQYINCMVIARAEALRKRVEYDSIKDFFEAKRSEMAMERAKIEKGIFDRGE